MATIRMIQVRSGKETTWGTAVTPTAKWMGIRQHPEITVATPAQVVQELRGSLAPGFVRYIARRGVTYRIPAIATYEDILFFLAAVLGPVNPTGTGPYTWTFNAPLSAPWTPQSYTLQIGHDGQTVQINGALMNRLRIRGEVGDEGALEVEGEGFGRGYDLSATLGGVVSDRTVEAVVMSSGSVTIAGTAHPASLISFELEIDNKLHPKWFGGDLFPQAYGFDRVESRLSVTLEATSSVLNTVRNQIIAANPVVVVLSFPSGSKNLTIRFAGVVDGEIRHWGERDGNVIFEIPLNGIYDATLANYLQVEVINNVSALP